MVTPGGVAVMTTGVWVTCWGVGVIAWGVDVAGVRTGFGCSTTAGAVVGVTATNGATIACRSGEIATTAASITRIASSPRISPTGDPVFGVGFTIADGGLPAMVGEKTASV